MGLSANINEKANLIWAIADKLTGVYKPHEYGEVILPLSVIRRFDCILGDTNEAVWARDESIKQLAVKDALLVAAAKQPFYNISKYTFERLLNDPDNIEENFHKYLKFFGERARHHREVQIRCSYHHHGEQGHSLYRAQGIHYAKGEPASRRDLQSRDGLYL